MKELKNVAQLTARRIRSGHFKLDKDKSLNADKPMTGTGEIAGQPPRMNNPTSAKSLVHGFSTAIEDAIRVLSRPCNKQFSFWKDLSQAGWENPRSPALMTPNRCHEAKGRAPKREPPPDSNRPPAAPNSRL